MEKDEDEFKLEVRITEKAAPRSKSESIHFLSVDIAKHYRKGARRPSRFGC